MRGIPRSEGLSIGSVVRTTGIPATTLRNWERRYGFPTPHRSEGGQRLYRREVVELLVAVAKAMKEGLKPSEILRDPWSFFDRVSTQVEQGQAIELHAPEYRDDNFPADWRKGTLEMDGLLFERSMEQLFQGMGLAEALDGPVRSFLYWIGVQWEQGLLKPYHEHFASEQVRLCLSRRWSGARASNGSTVICCTLPGELHDLGSHMVAAILASEGCHPVVLGRDLPVDSIIEAAVRLNAEGLAISAILASYPQSVVEQLEQLGRGLPRSCHLLVGGNGTSTFDNMVTFNGLKGLSVWISENLRRN